MAQAYTHGPGGTLEHPAANVASAPSAQAGPGYLVTDQRPVDPALAVIAWVLTVLTAAYLLPWAIAVSRGKSNAGTIGVVTLLLGWTGIGWIVALVFACQMHQVYGPPAGWYPSPDGYGRQYWDGRTWTGHRAP